MSDLSHLMDGIAARATVDGATASAWATAATRTATRRRRVQTAAVTSLLLLVGAGGVVAATQDRPGTRTLAPAGRSADPGPPVLTSSPAATSSTVPDDPEVARAGLTAVGNGWFSRGARLWTTADAGTSWQPVTLPGAVLEVDDYRVLPAGQVVLALVTATGSDPEARAGLELLHAGSTSTSGTVFEGATGGRFLDGAAQVLEVDYPEGAQVLTSDLSPSCCGAYTESGDRTGNLLSTSFAGGRAWGGDGTGAGRTLFQLGRDGGGHAVDLGVPGDESPPVDSGSLIVSVATAQASPEGTRTWRASSDVGATWRTVWTDPAPTGGPLPSWSDPVGSGSVVRAFTATDPMLMEQVDPARRTGSAVTVQGLPETAELDQPAHFSFADELNGWAVVNGQQVVATSDGGRTWTPVTLPS